MLAALGGALGGWAPGRLAGHLPDGTYRRVRLPSLSLAAGTALGRRRAPGGTELAEAPAPPRRDDAALDHSFAGSRRPVAGRRGRRRLAGRRSSGCRPGRGRAPSLAAQGGDVAVEDSMARLHRSARRRHATGRARRSTWSSCPTRTSAPCAPVAAVRSCRSALPGGPPAAPAALVVDAGRAGAPARRPARGRPEQAALWGAARVVGAEHPELVGRARRPRPLARRSASRPPLWSTTCCAGDGEDQAAIRDRRALRPPPGPAEPDTRPPTFAAVAGRRRLSHHGRARRCRPAESRRRWCATGRGASCCSVARHFRYERSGPMSSPAPARAAHRRHAGSRARRRVACT